MCCAYSLIAAAAVLLLLLGCCQLLLQLLRLLTTSSALLPVIHSPLPLLLIQPHNCSPPPAAAYQCAPLLLRLRLLVLPLEALRGPTVSPLQDGDGARGERLGHGHSDGGQLEGQPLRPLPGGVEGQRRHLVAPISWLAVGGYAGNWQPPPVRLLAELPPPLSLNFTFTSAAGTAAQVVGSWRLPRSAVSAAATWPGLPHTLGTTPQTLLLCLLKRPDLSRDLRQEQVGLGWADRWFMEPLREAG